MKRIVPKAKSTMWPSGAQKPKWWIALSIRAGSRRSRLKVSQTVTGGVRSPSARRGKAARSVVIRRARVGQGVEPVVVAERLNQHAVKPEFGRITKLRDADG